MSAIQSNSTNKRQIPFFTQCSRFSKNINYFLLSILLTACQSKGLLSDSPTEQFLTVESKVQIENIDKNSKTFLSADIMKKGNRQVAISLNGSLGISVASLMLSGDKGILILHRRKECIPFVDKVTVAIDSEFGAVDFDRTFIDNLINEKSTDLPDSEFRKIILEKKSYKLTWLVPRAWTKVSKKSFQIQLSCPKDYKIK